MQKELIQDDISKKSRGILYHLKNSLQKEGLSLKEFVSIIFEYQKQKFNKSQFQILIKKYDQNLVYDDIDNLFEELDDSKNGFVFYYRLQQIFKSINQGDNPVQKKYSIRQSLKDKVGRIFNVQPTLEQVKQQFKLLLLQSEDLYDVIDLFASQKTGYLTVQNVIQLIKNFQYENSKKRRILLQYIFGNRDKIDVNDFIEKLGLQSAPKRVNISRLQIPAQEDKEDLKSEMIDQDMQSQFVKSRMIESVKLQQSISMDLMDLKSIKSDDQFVNIEKIPKQLSPYFNYGSVLEPEFSYMATQYIGKEQFFLDHENPVYSKAFQWIHFSELANGSYTLFKVSESVLLRDKKKKGLGQLLESKDIIQGRLGDCYFLSAISAIVQRYPQLVYRLFVLDKNPAHIYGVRLFIDGQWKTIVVDACFPISKDRAFCGAQSYKGQIWVMLLQKAWAKVFGSYDQIHAGYNQQGLTAIAGAPSIHTSSRQDGFLKKIQVHLNKGSIITCATSAQVQQMTDRQQDQKGIYSNHAYTLMSIFYQIPYKDGNVTLLKIRNPWGRKQWKGDWSYYSSKWTKQLKQLTDSSHNPQDGSFFMSYEDFAIYFDFVNICQVNLSYMNSTLPITSHRNQFKVIKVRIKQKGDYFFTQYQENPRKYKNSFNYKKSKSWLFLSKIQKDKRIGIGSRSTQFRDNTLEATLDVGQYLIISKVSWNYWESHQYNLTSYGPQKVKLQIDNMNKYNYSHQISEFIASKSQLGFGKVSYYDKVNISKRFYFDATEGYGFFEVNNRQNKMLTTKIYMDPCRGIMILPPYGLPMTLQIFPNEKVIVKFIVNPSGYAYQYRENYYLSH